MRARVLYDDVEYGFKSTREAAIFGQTLSTLNPSGEVYYSKPENDGLGEEERANKRDPFIGCFNELKIVDFIKNYITKASGLSIPLEDFKKNFELYSGVEFKAGQFIELSTFISGEFKELEKSLILSLEGTDESRAYYLAENILQAKRDVYLQLDCIIIDGKMTLHGIYGLPVYKILHSTN